MRIESTYCHRMITDLLIVNSSRAGMCLQFLDGCSWIPLERHAIEFLMKNSSIFVLTAIQEFYYCFRRKPYDLKIYCCNCGTMYSTFVLLVVKRGYKES